MTHVEKKDVYFSFRKYRYYSYKTEADVFVVHIIYNLADPFRPIHSDWLASPSQLG